MDLKVPVLVSQNTGLVIQNWYQWLLLLLSIHPHCMVSMDMKVGFMDTGSVLHGFEGPGCGIKEYRSCNTEPVSIVTTSVIYSSELHGIHGFEGQIHGYR